MLWGSCYKGEWEDSVLIILTFIEVNFKKLWFCILMFNLLIIVKYKYAISFQEWFSRVKSGHMVLWWGFIDWATVSRMVTKINRINNCIRLFNFTFIFFHKNRIMIIMNIICNLLLFVNELYFVMVKVWISFFKSNHNIKI